ncbi:hypothetical protein NP493_3181g00004 [Ridgeia piscesae]|uniref:Uncharacterized protein n=1 Tax=Ridgeia piscesae TaxID=27915 RepID=A0AAD9MWQ0_RIDPI|nr:hypothetical protein NP493_3181g00004 [Ridgeia piscesae]
MVWTPAFEAANDINTAPAPPGLHRCLQICHFRYQSCMRPCDIMRATPLMNGRMYSDMNARGDKCTERCAEITSRCSHFCYGDY